MWVTPWTLRNPSPPSYSSKTRCCCTSVYLPHKYLRGTEALVHPSQAVWDQTLFPKSPAAPCRSRPTASWGPDRASNSLPWLGGAAGEHRRRKGVHKRKKRGREVMGSGTGAQTGCRMSATAPPALRLRQLQALASAALNFSYPAKKKTFIRREHKLVHTTGEIWVMPLS